MATKFRKLEKSVGIFFLPIHIEKRFLVTWVNEILCKFVNLLAIRTKAEGKAGDKSVQSRFTIFLKKMKEIGLELFLSV